MESYIALFALAFALVIAEMLPDSVIQEDEALQMYYDIAVTRMGVE